ncbi:hypothetical protein COU12_01840 [Candidatus Jorgensenbacteria bacterium CG10_big_fil_rev_8_21_14_0_10_54_38]|uniref:Aminoacyl-tRNA hydrolase n=2 Tax=Candidatus Joergenseniibacteriota TaxID=1752739 RepID=A0A2M6WFU5_9BACT|nr:MAG: hypothetical protein COX26_00175 [Candidatus Jorgensenbacteria bacterium CG23_combo_of_CG06-09_8_20_14_all_54_14]PIT91670.1 MAG: hypothetical protein COU12_01840 [Candidatus Jorgensenbacteria bacterium CG10_big_fil_rev_8_21_14_0_10_54_38]
MLPKMRTEFKWSRIKVAAGLGNPGAAYRHTHHNAGMEVLRALASFAVAPARRAGNAPLSVFTAPPRKQFSFLRSGMHAFVAPTTFMNESGGAVAEALRYLHAKKPEEFLLIHDDADLPLGTFRLEFGRGSAGHHGVQSVITSLGTKDFWRLRIGVRPKALGTIKETLRPNAYRLKPRMKAGLPAETRRVKAGDFILRRMTASEREIIKKTAEAIIQLFSTTGTKHP